MVDFLRNNIDRIIRSENSKVQKLNKATIINKNDERRKKESFEDNLKKASKKAENKVEDISTITNKEVEDKDVIVSSSLSKQFEQNRRLNELVNEKFVSNPKLSESIEFKGSNNEEEK